MFILFEGMNLFYVLYFYILFFDKKWYEWLFVVMIILIKYGYNVGVLIFFCIYFLYSFFFYLVCYDFDNFLNYIIVCFLLLYNVGVDFNFDEF